MFDVSCKVHAVPYTVRMLTCALGCPYCNMVYLGVGVPD
jgi:hypothetical protein